jgi:hypothetical protein
MELILMRIHNVLGEVSGEGKEKGSTLLPFPSASYSPTFRLYLETVLFSLCVRMLNSSSLEKVCFVV